MQLTEAQVLELLQGGDDAWLYAESARLCRENFGDAVYLRGIVEFSNVCANGCSYCGLRRQNADAKRYRLTREEIMESVTVLDREDLPTVVLQSGDNGAYSTSGIGEIIREVKSRFDMAVTLSLGDRPVGDYAHWHACGADRFLLRIETTNRGLYSDLRDGKLFEDRVKLVESLRNLGYEAGSGFMVGLPGTDARTTAQDILFLTSLGLDMIGVGPFIPHHATPLASEPMADPDLTYRTLAVLRLMNPMANMPATSALEAMEPGGRLKGLELGCNVIMPSVTPDRVRAAYSIYPGKHSHTVNTEDSIIAAKDIIRSIGRVPSASKGYSLRRNHEQQGPPRCPAGDFAGRAQECG